MLKSNVALIVISCFGLLIGCVGYNPEAAENYLEESIQGLLSGELKPSDIAKREEVIFALETHVDAFSENFLITYVDHLYGLYDFDVEFLPNEETFSFEVAVSDNFGKEFSINGVYEEWPVYKGDDGSAD